MLGYGGYNQYFNPNNYMGDTTWSGVIGGYDTVFGYRYNPYYSWWENEYGYWLAAVTNGMWTPGGELTGDVGAAPGMETSDIFGYYITPFQMGNIWGKLYGVNDTYYGYGGYWIAKSIGQFEGEPLDFGGDWYHSMLYDDDGWIEWASGGAHDQLYNYIPYPEGLFGLVQLPDNYYDFLAIGDFTDLGYGGGGYGGPYIWSGSIEGGEIIDGAYGYGGADGFTAGSWKKAYVEDSSGNMNGNAAIVYYTEAGKVGLISGDVNGDFYEQYYDGWDWYSELGYGGGMFITKGVLTATSMDTPDGYDPYTAWVSSNSLYADLAGRFAGNDDNTIFGSYYNGKTKFITYYDSTLGYYKSLPFGIYNLKLGDGWEYNYYYNKPPDTGSGVAWSAKVGGSGYFGYNWDGDDYGYWLADIDSLWEEIAAYDGDYGYGTIDGDLHGTYLTWTHKGTISGPFYGLYTEYGIEPGYGTWVGVSVGTYYQHEEDIPLDFGGYWGADSLYLHDGMGLNYVGYDDGRIGLTANDGTYDLLAIGKYQDNGFMGGYGGPYVWYSQIGGDEVSSSGGYGGFDGFSGGSWNASSSYKMNGYAAAIAGTDNGDGTVDGKLLYGPVSGDIFEMSEYGYGGMWMTEGTLNSVIMEDDIILTGDPVEHGPVDFTGAGGFGADGSTGYINVASSMGQSTNLIGLDWGAWTSMMGGGYGGSPPSDAWYMTLNNVTETHRWANVIGDKFSGGEVSADVAGAWVNITDATTGVMGGGLKGTFDPDYYTWQAVAVGTYIDTDRFLAMANPANTEGNAALEALNIPYIEVGRTDLSYSSGGTNLTDLNMNDVILTEGYR